MKEFLKNNKITYNLMSFTGFKSLVLFSLLVESPKSYQEICDYMLKHPYLHESISIDTLRVYINSLKRVGCEVKRIRERGSKVSKYTITSNPFKPDISNEQINSIVKIYKNLAKTLNIQELLMIERFLRKIIKFTKNDNLAEFIEKKSVFKGLDLDFVSDLAEYAQNKDQLVLEYNSPNSGRKLIEILADKVEYTNNTFYLCGTSFEHKQYGSFPVNRILGVKEAKPVKTIPAGIEEITVGFELKSAADIHLEPGEKLLGTENGKALIEITTSNKFEITQRLLSFGPDCKILYPSSFREEFVALLKQMREGYDKTAQ